MGNFRITDYICTKSGGVPYFQAEIRPYEPDADNTDVGNFS